MNKLLSISLFLFVTMCSFFFAPYLPFGGSRYPPVMVGLRVFSGFVS